jgi:tetratricopeptide (TPR) repeat protein
LSGSADAHRRAAVFISFSAADRVAAEEVSQQLEASNIATFFAPRDIHGGQNFAIEIVAAISACDIVVVLLSPSAIASPHVRREVSLAIDERRTLLPLAMPGTEYPSGFTTEWTYWLSAVQVMPYVGSADVVRRARALLPSGDSEAEDPARSTSTPGPRASLRRRPSTKTTPSSLLRPDAGVPRFVGREEEFARLVQWCAREDDFDARLVVGSAGQGKSRLARELMDSLNAEGWSASFLATGASATGAVLQLPPKPTLLVLDYAETRSTQLFEFLTALLEHGLHAKVRVLLLARTAGDWWRAFAARDPDIGELVADATIQALAPIVADRQFVEDLYRDSVQQFAVALRQSVPPIAAASYRPYQSMLDVLEDALSAVLGGSGEVSSGADRLLAHERRYIAAAAAADGIAEIDDIDLGRIAAAITLFGGSSEDETIDLVSDCVSDLPPQARRKVARLFRRLYPGSEAYTVGLRPDALAEELLADVIDDMGRLPGDVAGVSAMQRTPEQRRRALIVLARGAHNHRSVGVELARAIDGADLSTLKIAVEVATLVEEPDPLSEALIAAASSLGVDEIADLLATVPDETVALATFAAELARGAIAGLPEADFDLSSARNILDCSNRFSDAGWAAEAADSARTAVDWLRRLRGNQDADLVLGRALSNLSNRQWEIGQIAESLSPASEAVDVLDAAGSDQVVRAGACNNLAFRLCEVGRFAEALQMAKDAMRLLERSGVEDKTFGSVLNNLACLSLASGAADMALEYARRCVEVRRAQALLNRDRYLPYVARALANAAPAAEAAGDSDAADRMLLEARTLHRITASRAPIFRFEQAESATLGALVALGRCDWEAAARALTEAHDALDGIDIPLGMLRARLHGSLVGIGERIAGRDSLAVRDAATASGAGASQVQLPRLLEYRDL